ncbi:MAG: alpha/beta fold hydrolase [Parashewanella sp.]
MNIVSKTLVQQRSLFIPYGSGQLHVREVKPTAKLTNDIPLIMLHGSISNGKVFYSASGKGLACFLAEQGFTSYVIDMPGRGLSTPKLARGVNPSQTEVITNVLPLVQEFVLAQNDDIQKTHWIGHSWGGVLMSAALLRFPKLQSQVTSLVTFGTKRRLRARSLKKFLTVDVFWKRVSLMLIKLQGYLPADKLGFGMDNESQLSVQQTFGWLDGKWQDPEDGFDYQQQIEKSNLPPSWYFAAQNDPVLGNPKDVQASLDELKIDNARFTLLSKKNGNKQDYDHASMLTHSNAIDDHFLELSKWLNKLT